MKELRGQGAVEPTAIGRDSVTGLMDRGTALEILSAKHAVGGVGAVVVVNLDRFHHLNHILGYAGADLVLAEVSRRLTSHLRVDDLLARIGPDEFLAILNGPIESTVAVDIAVRLLEAIAEQMRIGDEDLLLTACAGVALSSPAIDPDHLLRQSTTAVRRAKRNGGNRVSMSTAADDQQRSMRMQTERALRRALEYRQLEVYYQPEYSLWSREIIGTEALVRWNHPERGLLTAEAFIGVAEDAGIVNRLGSWVMAQALADAADWHAAGHAITIRINLSTRQLLDDAVVVDLRNAIATHGLDPTSICFEVTETHLMQELDRSLRTLQRLKSLGVGVALDDFGTGFSSMQYLKHLPVDVLKIDRSFVDGMESDPENRAIVRSIVDLGNQLGLDVVAEGIETHAQIEELLHMGCDRGQGFYLARPMPARSMTAALGRNARRVVDARPDDQVRSEAV